MIRALIVSVFFVSALFLAACDTGLEETNAMLNVDVRGLVRTLDAKVTVSGPEGYEQTVTRSQTLTLLKEGIYTIAAQEVTYDGDVYAPSQSSTEISLTKGGTDEVEVTYRFQLDPDTRFLVATRDGVLLLNAHGESSPFLDAGPAGLEVLGDRIFILTYRGIEEFDAEGNRVNVVLLPDEVRSPLDFAVLTDGSFAVLDNNNDNVYFLSATGDFIQQVSMGVADNLNQNLDGIVVDNSLIISENGNNKLLSIDLSTYALRTFKDLSYLSGWLSGIGYKDGLYYVGQSMRLWSFEHPFEHAVLVTEFAEKFNVTNFVLVGNTAFATLNFAGEVQKINVATGEAETFLGGLNYPVDIELLGGN